MHASPSLHAVPVKSAHVPSIAAPLPIEHASHAPAPQAPSQQTPSTQKPDWHAAASPHGLPLGAWPVQLPPTQENPAAHSAFVRHDTLQAPAVQPYGAHGITGESWHAPKPLQCFALTPSPEQTVAQTVSGPYLAQVVLTPVQKPVWPHVDGAVAAQSSSGSRPAPTKPQVPSLPPPFFAAEHAWQGSPHWLLQQTPSTHQPEAQSDARLQLAPAISLGTQLPAAQ